jgi:hypothetical protein
MLKIQEIILITFFSWGWVGGVAGACTTWNYLGSPRLMNHLAINMTSFHP